MYLLNGSSKTWPRQLIIQHHSAEAIDLIIISHIIFKYSVWGRNKLLNFPFPSSLCCQSSVSLHPGKLAGAALFIFPSELHAVLWFGFSWDGCCEAAVPASTAESSESPPASLLHPEHDTPRAPRPKPQQPFAFRETCPQPPTAMFHLHGKLFWSVSGRRLVFLCTEDKSLLNRLNLSPGRKEKQQLRGIIRDLGVINVKHVSSYALIPGCCTHAKHEKLFSLNNIDIICRECIFHWALFETLQSVSWVIVPCFHVL